MKKNTPAVLLAIFLLVFWQIIAMVINAAYILPSPVQIAQKIWDLKANLFLVQLPATMSVTAVGLVISIVLGLLLAVIMDADEKIENALYPIIINTNNSHSASFRSLVRLQHMEQGSCNNTHNLLSHNNNGF